MATVSTKFKTKEKQIEEVPFEVSQPEEEKQEEVVVMVAEEKVEKKVAMSDPGIVFNTEPITTVNMKDPLVRIRTKVDHNCCIGGVTYHFEKEKIVNVPSNVKAILMRADLLMPL